MPSRTHDDSLLGTLRSDDGYLWEGKITLPGFGNGQWPETLDVSLYGEEEGFDPQLPVLLKALIENAPALPNLIVDA